MTGEFAGLGRELGPSSNPSRWGCEGPAQECGLRLGVCMSGLKSEPTQRQRQRQEQGQRQRQKRPAWGVGCARRTVFRCRERYPTLCPETKTGKGWGTRFLGGKGRTARVGGVARGSSRGLRQNLRSLSKAKAGGRMRQFRRLYQAYWSEPSSPPRSGIS